MIATAPEPRDVRSAARRTGTAAAAATLRGAVGAAEPYRTVEVDGTILAYDDEGAGPAVVCLHAIGHGAGDFAGLRARLAAAHRVVALDWPGQGHSGADRLAASAARYADLLALALDALAIERAVLVGNSIGGAAAIRYAASHPARVRGLVLENPGGLDRADRLARVVCGAMAAFFAAGARGAAWYPAAFAAYYRLVLQRPAAAAQRARIVAAGRELAPVLAEAWQSFATPQADLRALAGALACPVLVAWAARDQLVQLRRSLPAIQRIPHARLERFPAGHAAHLETPDAFEDAVVRFLAGLAP
jgi:4,5:9,10-diseco-3-hydroxy-5,9,17-trioxoandrosta-1(10),2-diene-4-oate hydrolase